MVRRHVFLALFVAAGLALSTPGASAATTARTAKTPILFERATPAPDGSVTSLILYFRDRLTLAYRALRGTRLDDPTPPRTDGIDEGPDGVDGVGAKGSGLHGATPAQTRLPG